MNQNDASEVGDWVVNTVKLPQYEKAFLLMGFDSLQEITKLGRAEFEKDIREMMEKVDNGKLHQHPSLRSKFMAAYDKLVQKYPRQEEEKHEARNFGGKTVVVRCLGYSVPAMRNETGDGSGFITKYRIERYEAKPGEKQEPPPRVFLTLECAAHQIMDTHSGFGCVELWIGFPKQALVIANQVNTFWLRVPLAKCGVDCGNHLTTCDVAVIEIDSYVEGSAYKDCNAKGFCAALERDWKDPVIAAGPINGGKDKLVVETWQSGALDLGNWDRPLQTAYEASFPASDAMYLQTPPISDKQSGSPVFSQNTGQYVGIVAFTWHQKSGIMRVDEERRKTWPIAPIAKSFLAAKATPKYEALYKASLLLISFGLVPVEQESYLKIWEKANNRRYDNESAFPAAMSVMSEQDAVDEDEIPHDISYYHRYPTVMKPTKDQDVD